VSVLLADRVAPSSPLADGIRYAHCDVREPIELQTDRTPDLVVNLAAVHRTPGHPDFEYYDTNVRGATNVVEWCRRHEARSLCFTSSISVYGPGEDAKDELSALTPVSAYGRSKAMAEEIHRLWREWSGPEARLVTVRPAVVFGPGEQGNFTRLAHALAARRFVYPGRDDAIKACGYVGEIVRAIDFTLAEDDRDITFNFCYPTPYTISDVCEAFHEVAGYDLPRRAPKAAMSAVAGIGRSLDATGRGSQLIQRVEKLLQSTNIRPTELLKRGFTWESDLAGGLRRWREESATGGFE
jgi:nucleoside-diphosphate-sugar epimerase